MKAVDRAIDDRVLPKGFFEVDGGRRLTPGACVMVAFYHKTAEDFSTALRKRIIASFKDRLRHVEFSRYEALTRENWTLSDRCWTVDLAPIIKRAGTSYVQLRQAEAAVSRDPDVMNGTEVLHGTRVPVRDVAASANGGATIDDIHEAYPSLSEQQINLAIVYAAAHPARGRQRGTVLPAGTERLERKVVRRKTAG
ncbi:DUF433 domain-containing protein [Aureimonas sp. ME7]|uniref:DUF433 domain-containing protein n=1 Tax=Aureimonas sp. ME7 TaxID=2744252 RepID=UPI0015FA5F35|nr:DUF433 domain-containing protein [Aureimonas sp. ME7]